MNEPALADCLLIVAGGHRWEVGHDTDTAGLEHWASCDTRDEAANKALAAVRSGYSKVFIRFSSYYHELQVLIQREGGDHE